MVNRLFGNFTFIIGGIVIVIGYLLFELKIFKLKRKEWINTLKII